MKLVCVATESSVYYEILKESAKRHNYELITLGWDQQWNGLIWKHTLYKQYLDTLENEEEVVILSDGYDVICLRDSKCMLEYYLKFNKPIVFGDQTSFSVKIAFDTFNKPVKCSGSIIGTVKYLKEMESIILNSGKIEQYNRGDQMLINQLANNSEHREFFDKFTTVDLDKQCFMVTQFDTMCNIDYQLYKDIGLEYDNNNNLFLKSSNTNNESNKIYPCILHAAGYVNINKICKKLGYDTTKIKPSNIKFKLKQIGNMGCYLIKNNKIYMYSSILIAGYLINLLKGYF